MVLFQEILALMEHGVSKSVQLPYLNVNLILHLGTIQKRNLLDNCINSYTTLTIVGTLTEEKYLALLQSIASMLFPELDQPCPSLGTLFKLFVRFFMSYSTYLFASLSQILFYIHTYMYICNIYFSDWRYVCYQQDITNPNCFIQNINKVVKT